MKWLLKYSMLLVFLAFTQAHGQTRVEVITKTVEKNFSYKRGYTLKIEGKSADIEVVEWESAEVKVIMKLISKGLTKEEATRELQYQKYVIDDIGKTHVIRNYLLLPKTLDELSTIQETAITLYVPGDITIEVQNAFGKTTLKQVSGNMKIENEYGEIYFQGTNGRHNVNSHFGDLKLQGVEGKLNFDLSHTETTIHGFGGEGRIKSNLGNVTVKDLRKISSLEVVGEKSDVSFETSNIDRFKWVIRSKYGEITAPERMTGGIRSIKNTKLEYGSASKPAVTISTDFGAIEIIE